MKTSRTAGCHQRQIQCFTSSSTGQQYRDLVCNATIVMHSMDYENKLRELQNSSMYNKLKTGLTAFIVGRTNL